MGIRGRLGARDPCAGRPPPDASLARPAIRGFPAAIAAGRGQAAAAPLSAPHGTGAGRPCPMDPTPGQAQLDGLLSNASAYTRYDHTKQRWG